MGNEGQLLKAFIDNQKESKTKIAEGLEMSRGNLYQLFESDQLEIDTKRKIEKYFGVQIFENIEHSYSSDLHTIFNLVGVSNKHMSQVLKIDEIDIVEMANGNIPISQGFKTSYNKYYGDIIFLGDNGYRIIDPERVNHTNNKNPKRNIKNYSKTVPVYDIDFAAGFSKIINDSPIIPIANLMIPEVQGCDFVIRARGNSMADYINDRDWIGIKEIKDRDLIIYGNPYAIVTTELQLIKYIRKSKTPDVFILRSENKEYDDMEVPSKKIKELYIVRTVLPFSKVKSFI